MKDLRLLLKMQKNTAKIQTLILVLSVLAIWGLASCATSDAANSGYVYECQGPKAKVYHSTPKCKGLNKCSTSVKKVQKAATKRRGCRICT